MSVTPSGFDIAVAILTPGCAALHPGLHSTCGYTLPEADKKEDPPMAVMVLLHGFALKCQLPMVNPGRMKTSSSVGVAISLKSTKGGQITGPCCEAMNS